MTIKSFRDLDIWIEGKQIAIEIYYLTNTGKFGYDIGLKDQIRRSAISIPSNISEGFGRENNNEFLHFLKIAKGSCAELTTQIEIAVEVKFLDKVKSEKILNRLEILTMKIARFINYLIKKNILTNRLTE